MELKILCSRWGYAWWRSWQVVRSDRAKQIYQCIEVCLGREQLGCRSNTTRRRYSSWEFLS
eukprot:1910571-Amphidinium_carterae.1